MPTVLVVDDDPDIRNLVRLALQRSGYGVLEAGDGRIALDVVAADHPDLVLLDLSMPVLDGHATLAALRSDPATADLPVVIISALSTVVDRRELLAAGAQRFVGKPFLPRQLVETVAEVLGRLQGAERGVS